MSKAYRNQLSWEQPATDQADMGQGQQNATGRNGMGNAARLEQLRLVTEDNGGPGTETGEPTKDEPKREMYLRHAQAVVTESNKKAAAGEDDFWKGVNGDNKGVHWDNGEKPIEWYRGIHADNNVFAPLRDQPRGSVAATGIDNIDELRTQIQDDLNFNGIFDKYEKEEAFIKALTDRFGEGCKERKVPIRPIAENLWAYGTTGMDVKQRTDVGELQGILYLLDPMIAEASESNTTHGGDFSIEDKQGASTEFDKHGDDDYGRASSLECRLLSSIVDSGDHEITGYDESYLLLDGSGSFKRDEYAKLAELLKTGGIDGRVALAGFSGDPRTLQLFESGDTITAERATKILEIVSDYVCKRDLNNLHKRMHEKVNGEEILPKNIPTELTGMGGQQREQGLACALAWMEEIEKMPGFDPNNGVKRQVVVATDEPDCNPGILLLLQTKAKKMNISVKVQYSFTKGAERTSYGGTGDSYVIVDVMALDVKKVKDGDYAGKNKPGHQGSQQDRTKQLDWYMASKDQQSKEESW
jgi:hypothetical protein